MAWDPSYLDSGIRVDSLSRCQGEVNVVDDVGAWTGLSGLVC